jgi:hypothetical protein
METWQATDQRASARKNFVCNEEKFLDVVVVISHPHSWETLHRPEEATSDDQ